MISIDENGLFTQVLLREIKDKGSRLLGKLNTDSFKEETKNFVGFLHTIATREVGDNSTKLQFLGKYYNVAILLVANLDNYYTHGNQMYINRVSVNINEGAESIYLCAKNEKRRIAEKVHESAKTTFNVIESKSFSYIGKNSDDRDFKGICIALKVKKRDKKVEKTG